MALEDGRVQEDRLIGQELVPVPSTTGGVEAARTVEAETFRGETEVGDDEHEQKDTSPELIQDVGPSAGAQSSLGRSLMTAVPRGGDLVGSQETRGQRGMQSGVRANGAGEDPMSPLVPEALWPGGPLQQVPPVFAPPGGAVMQPLFNFDQLRKLQELYASAPQVYGQQDTTEVQRPLLGDRRGCPESEAERDRR